MYVQFIPTNEVYTGSCKTTRISSSTSDILYFCVARVRSTHIMPYSSTATKVTKTISSCRRTCSRRWRRNGGSKSACLREISTQAQVKSFTCDQSLPPSEWEQMTCVNAYIASASIIRLNVLLDFYTSWIFTNFSGGFPCSCTHNF